MGNAGPFGNFDLSDMDLSLTSLCEGSNNLRELLMDISFPLTGDSSCVGSVGSGSGSFSGGSSGAVVVASVAVVLESVKAAVVLAAAVAEV